MPKYRHALPQLDGDLYLTDGGIETTLIFHDGLDLPHFADLESHSTLQMKTVPQDQLMVYKENLYYLFDLQTSPLGPFGMHPNQS